MSRISRLMPGCRRAGRFLLTALRWLGDRITAPVVLIPLIVLLATWVGFQQNAGLYMRGTLPSAWYDATLIAVLLLPPLTGQVTAWVSGYRSAFWWLLWVPAVALYWLRPWHTGTEWALFWREHLGLWQILVQILREQEQAPLRSFVRLGAILTMALVSFMVLARPWMRFTTWLRDLGRDAGEGADPAGGGKAEGLPRATWASAGEVRDTFSHKGGIVLGEHTDPLKDDADFDPDNPRSWKNQGKGRLITMNPASGNGHVVVLAASAGYKTAGVVIPNILHYTNPLVVVDPKGDLYARTREAREAMGFTARVIDAQHGFDPFKMIAPLAPEAPSVYLTMARTLMPLSSRSSDISEYFHEMSTALFAALIGHFIAEKSDNVARDISRFINRERTIVIAEAQRIASRHNFSFINDEMEGLAALDERTFPGVVKGISNKLAFTRFPDAAAYGQSGDSPDAHLAALGPKSDIFINFPTLAARDFPSFPRLLIGAMYVTSELVEQPDRPRARRLFLIDEARVLGGLEALTNIRDAGRSIGLHLMLIYQNYGQLVEAWGGEAGAGAWLDSCEARVISAVGSSRTASDIVTMLGRRTLRTRVQGSSASNPVMTPMGGTVSSSEQEQIREVPLMSAATLGQLPAHGSLIFTRRSRPILATKAIFFTRAKMAPLVKSPDEVTGELEATRRRNAVINQMKARAMQVLPDPQPGLRPRAPKQPEQSETDADGSVETPGPLNPVAGDPPAGAGEGGTGSASMPDGTSSPPRDANGSGTTAGGDPEKVDIRNLPNARARAQARIAAVRARKDREQKEALEQPTQNPDTAQAEGTGAVPGSGSEAPQARPADIDALNSNEGQGPVPAREAHMDDTAETPPDPDGLSRHDRMVMTTIMGLVADRPELRSAVTRALQAAPGRDTPPARDTRQATRAGATPDVDKTAVPKPVEQDAEPGDPDPVQGALPIGSPDPAPDSKTEQWGGPRPKSGGRLLDGREWNGMPPYASTSCGDTAS